MEQFENLDNNTDIEILVSDNCSSDETEEIINKFLQKGCAISYYRNKSNIGADGNFMECYKKAKGKFIWLLGDDDYITNGALQKIIDVIRKHQTAGLIHLGLYNLKDNIIKFEDSYDFLSKVSFFITFMSSNIFNSEYCKDLHPEIYKGTSFIQCPMYLTSAWKAGTNIYINFPTLEIAKDGKSNGGYNIWKVFINNYLSIQKHFMPKSKERTTYYKFIRRNIYEGFLIPYITSIIIRKEDNNFKTESFSKYYFKHYLFCWYAHYQFLRQWAKYKIFRRK